MLVSGAHCGQVVVKNPAAGRHSHLWSPPKSPGNIDTTFSPYEHVRKASQSMRTVEQLLST
jgi:hypothetical protein